MILMRISIKLAVLLVRKPRETEIHRACAAVEDAKFFATYAGTSTNGTSRKWCVDLRGIHIYNQIHNLLADTGYIEYIAERYRLPTYDHTYVHMHVHRLHIFACTQYIHASMHGKENIVLVLIGSGYLVGHLLVCTQPDQPTSFGFNPVIRPFLIGSPVKLVALLLLLSLQILYNQ